MKIMLFKEWAKHKGRHSEDIKFITFVYDQKWLQINITLLCETNIILIIKRCKIQTYPNSITISFYTFYLMWKNLSKRLVFIFFTGIQKLISYVTKNLAFHEILLKNYTFIVYLCRISGLPIHILEYLAW